nr:class I SAM-dependent methyltransferase [Candidatus Omnitrophota bacterium]
MLDWQSKTWLKIISAVVLVTFAVTSTCYGIDLPNKTHLRPNLTGNSKEGRDRLQKALSFESGQQPEPVSRVSLETQVIKFIEEMQVNTETGKGFLQAMEEVYGWENIDCSYGVEVFSLLLHNKFKELGYEVPISSEGEYRIQFVNIGVSSYSTAVWPQHVIVVYWAGKPSLYIDPTFSCFFSNGKRAYEMLIAPIQSIETAELQRIFDERGIAATIMRVNSGEAWHSTSFTDAKILALVSQDKQMSKVIQLVHNPSSSSHAEPAGSITPQAEAVAPQVNFLKPEEEILKKIFASLGFDSFTSSAFAECVETKTAFGLMIRRFKLNKAIERANLSQGIGLLVNEMINTQSELEEFEFEVLYNDKGIPIAIFPVLTDQVRGILGKASLRYFDLGPYYFDIKASQPASPHAKENWELLRRQRADELELMGRYKEAAFGSKWAKLVDPIDRKSPYTYVAIDSAGNLEAKEIDLYNPVIPAYDSEKKQIIIPIFPTVITPGQYSQDDDFYYFKNIHRAAINENEEVLVVGPGSGIDAWVASFKSKKTIYAIGINPLEILNTQLTAQIGGFSVEGIIADNIVSEDLKPRISHKRFDWIFWNMPAYSGGSFSPELVFWRTPAYWGGPYRYSDYWDGDYKGRTLQRFAQGLHLVLKPNGQAVIWNRAMYIREMVEAHIVEEILRNYGLEVLQVAQANYRIMLPDDEVKALISGSGIGVNGFRLTGGAILKTRLDEDEAKLLMSDQKEQEFIVAHMPDSGKLRVIKTQKRPWDEVHTSLSRISKLLNVDLASFLRKYQKEVNRPITVLDWGCAGADALIELAEKLKDIPVTFIGFSDIPFTNWNKAPPNVTFILDAAMQLSLYFNQGSVDIIYSMGGLSQLPLLNGEGGSSTEHLKQLYYLLHQDGVIVTNDSPKGTSEAGFRIARINEKSNGYILLKLAAEASEAERATTILTQNLLPSKPISGGSSSFSGRQDEVVDIVETVTIYEREYITDKLIAFEMLISPEEWTRQIAQLIVDNAIKYCPEYSIFMCGIDIKQNPAQAIDRISEFLALLLKENAPAFLMEAGIFDKLILRKIIDAGVAATAEAEHLAQEVAKGRVSRFLGTNI